MPSVVGLSSLAIQEQTARVLEESVDIFGESPCIGPGGVESNISEPWPRCGLQKVSPVLPRPYIPHLSPDLLGKLPRPVLLPRHKAPSLMQKFPSLPDTGATPKCVGRMVVSRELFGSLDSLQTILIVAGLGNPCTFASVLSEVATTCPMDRSQLVRVVYVQDEHLEFLISVCRFRRCTLSALNLRELRR